MLQYMSDKETNGGQKSMSYTVSLAEEAMVLSPDDDACTEKLAADSKRKPETENSTYNHLTGTAGWIRSEDETVLSGVMEGFRHDFHVNYPDPEGAGLPPTKRFL